MAVPAPPLSLGLAAGVAMDEALLAMAMTPNRFPRRADFARVSAELADARRLFSRRGWIARPASYHRTPPPLTAKDVETSRGMGASAWATSGSPTTASSRRAPASPAASGGWPTNPTVGPRLPLSVTAGEPRPWVVCVHGFCMGYPFMDFMGLHTAKLHRELGLNVALPVLPLHGPRKVTLVSGEPFLSFDMMNTVHGLTQAVWDIRRLVSWIRAQGATSIGLYGVSLGAYVVSLLAGIEEGFDAVVAGIPVVDFPSLFHEHSPVHIRARSIEHHILGGAAEDVYQGGVADELRVEGPARSIGTCMPATVTAWPPRSRPACCGSTGTSRTSAGTRGTTWAICGPARWGRSWESRWWRPGSAALARPTRAERWSRWSGSTPSSSTRRPLRPTCTP
jgi:hypothetical protein